jgi:hypothetical protein
LEALGFGGVASGADFAVAGWDVVRLVAGHGQGSGLYEYDTVMVPEKNTPSALFPIKTPCRALNE